MGFQYELLKSGVNLIKIPKFYQQQRECNCWWKITMTHHTLQSVFGQKLRKGCQPLPQRYVCLSYVIQLQYHREISSYIVIIKRGNQ